MNLIKFLLIGLILSLILGEFGQVPFGSPMAISVTDIMVGMVIIFFIIWHVLVRKLPKVPILFKWILAFEIFGLLSLVISLTWLPLAEVIKGGLYLVRFTFYSFLLFIVYNIKKERLLSLETLIDKFFLVGFALTFLGFVQLLFLPDFALLTDFGYDPHKGRLASTFLDPNFLGAFLVLSLGPIYLLLKNYFDKKWIILTGIALISILLTYSRSAYLMLFVILIGLIFYNWKFIKTKVKFLIVLFLLLGTLATLVFMPRVYERIVGGLTVDKSASARLVSWQNGWEVFKSNPISGVGFNNVRIAQEKLNLFPTFTADGGHSGGGIDSSFLLVLATTGVVGFFIYIRFWFESLKSILKNVDKDRSLFLLLFIALLLNTQFINSLFHPSIMVWYFSLLGVIQE